MNPETNSPRARAAHLSQLREEIADTPDRRRMLDLLMESSPPSADAPPPAIPEDLRRRLEERYGRPKPGVAKKSSSLAALLTWWQDFAAYQRMALGGLTAAAALVMAFIFSQRPAQPEAEIMRGAGDPSITAGPQILWLKDPAQSEVKLAVEAKIPSLADINTLAEAQAISKQRTDAVILIDPAARLVTVLKNGTESLRESIRPPQPPDGEADAILRALRAAERSLEP